MFGHYRRTKTLLLATVFAVALGGGAATSAANPRVVSSGNARMGAAERVRVFGYWTRERMAAAQPLTPALTGDPGTSISTRPTGKAHAIAGQPPGRAASSASAARRAGRAAPTPAFSNFTYPFPFSRWTVDRILYPGYYPYSTIGKLFFVQNGGNFVCSASSVPTSVGGLKRPVLWTAGHCLSNGAGVFSTNVLFVPAYEVGAQPYGAFPCGSKWVATAWHTTGDFTQDMGACAIGKNASGQTLPSRVGTLGFAWNQSRFWEFSSFGYPQGAPFNGSVMVTCQAAHATDDAAVPGVGQDPIGIGCDMTGGSSGGPWVLKWKGLNWVNGHNDYKYTSTQPLAMYSPYFDTLANQIRCGAATGSATSTC